MRRCRCFLAFKIKKQSESQAYRPRFRPRRLVMPVNPSEVHGSFRSQNPLWEKHMSDKRLRKAAERRGALTLGTIPSERTVGDAFTIMLEVSEKEGLLNTSVSLTPKHMMCLETLLKQEELKSEEGKPDSLSHSSTFYALGLSSERDTSMKEHKCENSSAGLTLREIDLLWQILYNTPLNSPVHGILAERGKSLVESILASEAYKAFPRLRSKHLQALLHESCGLLPCGRIALRLGFAELCGVEGEINMWRELNVLTERFNTARRNAAAHRQRLEKGVSQQRRWYWKAVLRSSANRLKLFPVHQDDLRPRMEWIRSSIFAFVAFLEIAQESGDSVNVEILVKKLFCSQLARFLHTKNLIAAAEKIINGAGQENVSSGFGKLDKCSNSEKHESICTSVSAELRKLAQYSRDDLDVLDEKVHPMNEKADTRREQFASSGGAHAMQSLRDDIFDDFQIPLHHDKAPPIILHSIRPQNAFKEAQIILRYDPNVPPKLSSAPIDVEQVVRKITEVHETNPYASLFTSQQYRQVEYTVCELFAGNFCIGQGKGETLMMAMNEAAEHTLLNYYLRGETIPSINSKKDASHNESQRVNETNLPDIRINKTVDEEIVF